MEQRGIHTEIADLNMEGGEVVKSLIERAHFLCGPFSEKVQGRRDPSISGCHTATRSHGYKLFHFFFFFLFQKIFEF